LIILGAIQRLQRCFFPHKTNFWQLLTPSKFKLINAQFFSFSGEIFTREPLDREAKAVFELIAEARDLGSPPRSSRVPVKVQVTDVNDNAPLIVEPEEDVIGVREQQPVGTEVVRVRAIDRDEGENSSITYSIVQSEYIPYY
jgi:protocadherin-16/23